MSTPYDDLQNWVTVLQALQSASAGINADTQDYTLNAFAKLTMCTLLKAKNTASFAAAVSKKLGYDITPYGWTLQDTFATMTEVVTGKELVDPVRNFIASCCDPACINPLGTLDLNRTLADAYPATAIGNANWSRLINGIDGLNLDSVIVSPTGGKLPSQIVSAKLSGLRAKNPPPALNDLLTYLSTIA
jgi:hypothetical protein